MYGFEIQGWHGDGYGWEAVSMTDALTEAKGMLSYYQGENPDTEYRIIKVRMNHA